MAIKIHNISLISNHIQHGESQKYIRVNVEYDISETLDLFCFTLLSGDSFKFAHVSCLKGGSNHRKVVNLRHFTSSLIILEKELYVLNVLELDILQWDDRAVQLSWRQAEILGCCHRVGLVKIQRGGLVHEDSNIFWAFVPRSLNLHTVNLDSLVERQSQYELFIAVRLEVSASPSQTVAVRMFVVLIETFGLSLVKKCGKIHKTLDSTVLRVSTVLAIMLFYLSF